MARPSGVLIWLGCSSDEARIVGGVGETAESGVFITAPEGLVQYRFWASTATFKGEACAEAITTGARAPSIATLITVPAPPLLAQYTLVASRAMPAGPDRPVARVVRAPPPTGTLITVPVPPLV